MNGLIELVTGVLWEYILLYLLLGVGIYFSVITRFVQVRHFFYAWKIMFSSRAVSKDNISSFQALCTSLAAHVGTGNLAGVAIALYLGGPGAIFWMWVVAILGMSTSYIESTLAQLYKEDNNDGTFRGGPAYYMEKALGMRWLGIVFSVLLIVTFGFTFNSVHANSLSASLSINLPFDEHQIGLALAGITALIIFRGIKVITSFAERVVPFMALTYIGIALLVTLFNYDQMPSVMASIIGHAFGPHQAVAGGIGYSVAQAIMQGIKRGLFSNEAGMGSAPNAAATATPWPHHPATQGIISMTSAFIDTVVICSGTAAIVLLSGQLKNGTDYNGIQLTQMALGSLVGGWGEWFIMGAVIFFGFTSIVANYYYGESNLLFIKNSAVLLFCYRLAVVLLVYLGAVCSLDVVWMFADLTMGLMALINLVVIFVLSGSAIAVLKDHDRQLSQGKHPTFNRHHFPSLDIKMDKDVWIEHPDIHDPVDRSTSPEK